MRFLLSFTVLAWSSMAVPVFSYPQPQNQNVAAKTKRLPPTAFPQLPPDIVRSLQKRGCLIPQVWSDRRSHNVISGEFMKKGQKDWAVLCSRKDISSILVFWGGNAYSVSEIARSPDKIHVQIISERNKVGYSRHISAVGREYIISHYKAYGGEKPPPIRHQGIDDAFVEKASMIHYRYRGKWLKLQGAD